MAQARTTATEGVARQGVRDRGQGPDGQIPPARRGRDRVHEHARADGGQVQSAGAQGAAAVQGQRDAQAGEDQGGGVGDRRLERGDGGQVAGGVGHPVLGGEADRSGRRGQHAEPGGGVAEPQAGAVVRRAGLAGPWPGEGGRAPGRSGRGPGSRTGPGGGGWPALLGGRGRGTSGIGRVTADLVSGQRWGAGIQPVAPPPRSGGLPPPRSPGTGDGVKAAARPAKANLGWGRPCGRRPR